MNRNHPEISIIIICDKIRQPQLDRLLNSIKPQLNNVENNIDTEILLLHESNSPQKTPVLPLPVRYLPTAEKQGIPFNRNQGLTQAHGNIIIFIDDDCWVPENWLKALLKPLQSDKNILAVTGGTKVPPSTLLGDSIAALGFPGGGLLGFDKVWKVSSDGFTNHLSVGNCALRKELFSHVGLFDEQMKFGAEDTEFSQRMERAGILVKYVPQAYAFHEARTSWNSFVQWQLRRGRANYHFKKKVGKVHHFITLRVWSAKNIMQANITKARFPLVIFLLGSSFVLQQYGYFREKWKNG